jgi:membrane protein
VLIGAAFNAAVRELWPHEEQRSLRQRLVAWVSERRRTRTERGERPAGWDDPFDDYGTGTEGDDLGLAGLRDAARGPLTPISGAGRSAAPRAVPGAPRGPDQQDEQVGQRVDVER